MEAFLSDNKPVIWRLSQDYVRRLGSGRPTAATEAAILAFGAFDEIAGHIAGDRPPVCEKGCFFCCHVKVNLTPCEAFALARGLGTLAPDVQAEVRDRLAAAAARIRGLDVRARWALRLACPLTDEDGACRVYDFRPLACRAHASLAADACREEFETGRDVGVPAIRELAEFRALISSALSLAEGAAAGRVEMLELVSALGTLTDPGAAEAAWLGGREVLADACDGEATERRRGLLGALGR